jgi:uncharacterized protein (TIGR00255 family)
MQGFKIKGSNGCDNMVVSMTGFGRGKAESEKNAVTVEMKSVNHRFCEVMVRMPRQLVDVEDKLKKIVGESIKRGRIEVFVTVSGERSSTKSLQTDYSLLQQYVEALKTIEKEQNLPPQSLSFQDILEMEGVFTTHDEEGDNTEVKELVQEAARKAVSELYKMRQNEGERLKEDLMNRMCQIEKSCEEIAKLAPTVSEQYRERIQKKLQEHLGDSFDEQRVLTEVAIFAEKADISEEITRINSHIREFKETLESGAQMGRKLDFLVQELNREGNTIGAKAHSSSIASLVIDIKTNLERIKEQVQNIE